MVVTNLEEWMLIRSTDEKTFHSSSSMQLIFEEMASRDKEVQKENKEYWMEECSELIDVLYTILKNELQESIKMKKVEKEVSFLAYNNYSLILFHSNE